MQYILPAFLIILLLFALAIYGWLHRNVPGAIQFTAGSLIAVLWLFGSVMEYLAVTASVKIFWMAFQAVCQLPAITANTCFLLEYAWPGRWLSRRNLTLLIIPPVLFTILALTNPLHHLVWINFSVEVFSITNKVGPTFWPFFLYGFGLGLLQIGVYFWLLWHSPQTRWPVTLMLIGHIGSRTIFLLDRFEMIHATLPLDTLLIGYLYFMYAIALFTFRFFNPISLARQTIIAQMQDGLLVLNLEKQITSINPAAEAILGVKEKHVRRRPVQDYFSVTFGWPENTSKDENCEIELRFGKDEQTRDYLMTVSPLKEWRGTLLGYLLLLRDVTEKKHTHLQIIEQQRALAILHERELLARELHDSTSQVLAYIGLQIGVTRKFIADQKLAIADDQLARLESVVSEAHADVRKDILNLRAGPADDKPFFAAIRQYLDGYQRNYGIRVDLHSGTGICDEIFTPEAQIQIFRILQEALSNAYKHAEVKNVQLSFEKSNDLIHMLIQDNGHGFDPQHAAKMDDHYGLHFMHERAAQLGGTLQVRSTPGTGTCVELVVPAASQRVRFHEENQGTLT